MFTACYQFVSCVIAALIKFRGTDDVELDMQEMRYEVENQSLVEYWSWKDLFQSKILRMPLLILCAAACCQQLSGINVVSELNFKSLIVAVRL